jgi:hypothetical protein
MQTLKVHLVVLAMQEGSVRKAPLKQSHLRAGARTRVEIDRAHQIPPLFSSATCPGMKIAIAQNSLFTCQVHKESDRRRF